MKTIKYLITLILLTIFANTVYAATDCSTQTDMPPAQCDALVALYNSTDGANWSDSPPFATPNKWNQDNSPCSWTGVFCSGINVGWLDRTAQNLDGTLPDLSALTSLQGMYLGGNQLTGSIPDLSALTSLDELYLDNNQLTGSIPNLSTLTNLTEVYINNNLLTGSIPGLSTLINLQILALNYNDLSGMIPALNTLTNLQILYLNGNLLTGTIPDVSLLTNLLEFHLDNNLLTGSIPDLSTLVNLVEIKLHENQLTGSIPNLSSLTNLVDLLLNDNLLTGGIPDLSTLGVLAALDLSNNSLCKYSGIDYTPWNTEVNIYADCPLDGTSFITTWKTDNPGTSNSTSITIPTTGGGYSYDVDWDNDGTFEQSGLTGDVTHDFGTAGTYTIRIQGSFPQIYFNNAGDRQKILDVEQWGNIAWGSMNSAFYGASNLQVSATDSPDLSSVTNMSSMFRDASAFNQDINSWNVSNVTSMGWMFSGASVFNQPLNTWIVNNVTGMQGTFNGASAFNQDISSWNVSNVGTMQKMFQDASSFNQPLNSWNVIGVSTMSWMFDGASSFNQPLNNWNVSNITGMYGMFQDATIFNQDISNWNVSNAVTMRSMFQDAIAFNQDLSGWDVISVNNMTDMFNGVTLSTANYDSLIVGWDSLALQPTVTFEGGGSQYTCGSAAATARANIISTYSWGIFDGGCIAGTDTTSFITTWKTDNPGTSNPTSITIPTKSSLTYSYDVDWNNDGIFDEFGITGDVTHDFSTAGTYTIRIQGSFPRIYFNDDGDKDKILDVEQWGSIAWKSMSSAFQGASNLRVTATDSPDLSDVTSMYQMFQDATTFNQDISNWNVSTVTDMAYLFYQSSFNQDISAWDVSNVTDMAYLFYKSSFNQDISAWNVSNAIDMHRMFQYSAFNQDISSWNVISATDMRKMFDTATAFNQDIGSWNVSNVTTMESMFDGATAFNQDLSTWNVSSVADMTSMFLNVTLSTANYNALLVGWDSLALQPNVNFHGGNSQYTCSSAADTARANMTNIVGDNWTITDGGCITPTGNLLVDTLGDINDGDNSVGNNTLREAITYATAGDTITFDSSIVGQTINLNDQLTIDKGLTIQGSGQILDAGFNSYRVIKINTPQTVNLSNMTITNGNSSGSSGGGIYARDADLNISNVVFDGNYADDNGGGGLDYRASNRSANVSLTDCLFTGNHVNDPTNAGGGAIRAGARNTNILSFSMDNCTLESNIIDYGSSSGGGGIRFRNTTTTTVIGTTTATVRNSTFYKNSASEDGGAIEIMTKNVNLTLLNSTIAFNDADAYGNGTGQGGGIYTIADSTVNIQNSIIADNTLESSTTGYDCMGTLNSLDYNLIGNTNDCTITGSTANNLTNLSPMFGTFANHGGLTETLSLLPTSPAIDTGDNATCLTTDQRGTIRPKDGDQDGTATCDIGAYEAETIPLAPSGLNATSISPTQINLSWTDNSNNETGFKIERDSTLITTIAADVIIYSDIGLTCNTTYSYSVKATNAVGDSAAITASATTQACPVEITVYHKLTVEKAGKGTITYDYGITCGNDCEHNFADQTELTLTATPDKDWKFIGWTGDCDKDGLVIINKDKTCIATFEFTVNNPTDTPTDNTTNDNSSTDNPTDNTTTDNSSTDDNQTNDNSKDTSSNELAVDGNGDGIQDNKQRYVITIPDAISGEYITIASHIGCPIKIASAHTEEEQAFENENYSFPQGIVYYEIQCSKVNLTIYFHGMSIFRKKPVYKKFGPLIPGDLSTLSWYTLPDVIFAIQTVNDKPVATAKFTLIDGELGDNTGIDGKIVDPGGITFE
ncbi:BspA family leucine-rich repeat surface protein [Candidatus Halobeggiatoa sp. HSG11]|nr:BspA family leucine-rich repeat surface protein [Candidatus Halobeggiatoa sp. HSG11]